MSTSLLKSKQFKSKKNLKNLSISSPIIDETTPKSLISPNFANSLSLSSLNLNEKSPLSPTSSSISPKTGIIDQFENSSSLGTVILVARYDFQAETDEELNIKANDFLKLLQRPGDGWLQVKKVTTKETGLIPASYVKIAVNDLISPITQDWLVETMEFQNHETSFDSRDLFDFEKYDRQESHKSDTPKNITVSQVLRCNEKFWYRVDFKMENGDEVFLVKSYQEFYDLHYKLSLLNHQNLPSFPQPFNNHNIKDRKYLEMVLIRCNELNVYMNKLMKFNYYKKSKELMTFISECVQLRNPRHLSNEFINDSLRPNCVSVIDILQPHHNTKTKNFSPTAPLPVVESPSFTSFTSIIDSYETEPTSPVKKPELKVNPMTPQMLNDFEDDVLTPMTPSTPPTPLTPIMTPHKQKDSVSSVGSSISSGPKHGEFVKIKVIFNETLETSDIVVIKVNKNDLQTMQDLKRMVSYKIYKDSDLISHYKLLVKDTEDMNDGQILRYVMENAKVTFTLVRIRGSI